MSKSNPDMPLGLDVGTSRIVLARPVEDGYDFRAELNAFTTVPFTKLAESVLKKENVPYVVEGQEIIVYGNEAARFADLANRETRRPMLKGTLTPGEANNLTLLRHLIAHLLGPAEPGRKIFYSVPAPAEGDADESVKYHDLALRDLLTGMGYQAKGITEGLAVIYAELEDTNYTGIGVSMGGGMCNITLAHLSVPILSFSITKGGDFVDLRAAHATGENATRVRMLKEQSFKFNGGFPDRIHQALGVYYDEMTRHLASAMTQAFADERGLPKLHRPIPLVLSGGSSMPHGFRERFEKVLRESDFPIELSEVRAAADPLHSTAKGALIAAIAEN